jgi:hypothetical protein
VVHKDLEGFDIQINAFGEVTSSFGIERLNDFLNEHVDDLKLQHLKPGEEEAPAPENQDDAEEE